MVLAAPLPVLLPVLRLDNFLKMRRNFCLVPWLDSEEWLRVYSALFLPSATSESAQAALQTVLVWKARQPTLPSGVESTLSILEINSQAENGTCEKVLRLSYSAALMRFVNHMLDSEQAKGLTLYRAAKQADLPDWVVDLRHSAAHGDSLPSLNLLRHAADVALEWLKRNYWDTQKESIEDYVVGEQTLSEDCERRLARLISFGASLSICSRSEPRIRNLSEIPDGDMREDILIEARDLFGCDFPNPEHVTISQLTSLLITQSSKLLKSSDAGVIVDRTLLDENSLFLSLEMLNIYDEMSLKENKLSKAYVASWNFLLTLLHDQNLLVALVEDLVLVSNDSEKTDGVCKLSALWIREILQALKRIKIFTDRLKKLRSSGKVKENKSSKQLYGELFPKHKSGLHLNMTKGIPEELTKLSFALSIIKSGSPYLHLFIRDLLYFQQNLSVSKKAQLYRLSCVLDNENIDTSKKVSEKVYGIDDIKNRDNSPDTTTDSDCIMIESNESNNDVVLWTLASDDEWSKCPIGVLPWQIKIVPV